MNYIVIGGIPGRAAHARARAISRQLFRLHSPDHLRHPKDITTDLLGIIEHPEDGRIALEVPDGLEFNIHPRTAQNPKGDYRGLFPGVPARELNEIESRIDNAATGRGKVRVQDVFPVSRFEVKTREEMEAEGWFPEILIP